MMIKIYCVTLLLLHSVHSFSMDRTETLKDKVALIGTRIDHEIINTDEKPWFIPAIGCCLSFYTTSFSPIAKPQVIRELATIESMEHINNDILQKLYKEHSYFARLIDVVVQDEVEQLNNVTITTLDTLSDTQTKIPNLSTQISAFIHDKAHNSYKKKLKDTMPYHRPLDRKYYSLGEEEIHVMPLKKESHVPCKLAICDKGKYLKAFNAFGDAVIWDIETGKEVDKIPADTLITKNKRCDNNNLKIVHENLMITCGYADYPYGPDRISEYFKKHSMIPAMVVIRPTVISWLCQQVFLQSRQNEAALIKLRDSQAVAHMQGVAKIMLLRFIDVALAKLERDNKQED